MTKLAIAGDSFATVDPTGNDCAQHNIPYLWPEELARNHKTNTSASGVGGADIFASTFRATQQVINDSDISHMLFFITDFNRDLVVETADINSMIHSAAEVGNLLHSGNFYEQHDVETHSRSDGNKFAYMLKEATDTAGLYYFAKCSPEKTLHTAMACLSQLSLVCKKHNVDLIFVHTCFYEQESFIHQYAKQFMLDYKYYSYVEVLGPQYTEPQSEELFNNRMQWPAHMSPKEQPQLLKGFNFKFPSWLNQ